MRFANAGPGDVDAMTALVVEGFETYRAFAPPGWEPPGQAAQAGRISERLHLPTTWARLAFDDDGRPLAVTGVLPIPGMPDLAHLWLLFVTREQWGTGLARRLHDEALNVARAAGRRRIRLFTPAGQVRARAFYRGAGWTDDDIPYAEPGLGLDLVELRRAL
jgi:GNAT superfamily N-acetyltransferase